MRFTVGKTYTFARVLFTPGNDRFGTLYYPWLDKLNKIEVINLVCVEHHKVPWDQDPKKEAKYDGFLFKELDSDEYWSNQYPSASYGQLDDSGDYRVYKHSADEEIEEDTYFNPFTLATSMLSNIYRSLHPGKHNADGKELTVFDNEVQDEAMRTYLSDFVAAVEEVSGKKVTFEAFTYRHIETGRFKTSRVMQARLRPKED